MCFGIDKFIGSVREKLADSWFGIEKSIDSVQLSDSVCAWELTNLLVYMIIFFTQIKKVRYNRPFSVLVMDYEGFN